MKKNYYLALACTFLLTLGCTRDNVASIDDINGIEKPTKPGTEEPGKPTDPTGPVTEGDTGIDINQPTMVANFNDFTNFKKALNKFKLPSYALEAVGKGKDGKGALSVIGNVPANAYLFTVENQTVTPNAKTIVFYLKGTADRSLSFNVYKADGSYDVFNLRTDEQIAAKTDITLDKDVVLNKTAKKQDGSTNGANDYVGVNIKATNWIKVTLNLSGVDYNKSTKGSLFAVKVGKSGTYNLLFDSFTFDANKPTDPTGPIDPTDPTGPTKPGDFNIPADQKAYYSSIDFSKTGMTLKDELSKLVTTTHKKNLSYNDIVPAAQSTDLTPDGKNVYLLYGHQGVNKGQLSYTREKGAYEGKGGTIGSDGLQWNKEHTYAKSLGTPNLNTSGPGADAHHLRPADKAWNNARSSLKFAKGSGFSGSVSGGWYPGDEWKGDVARMMMYMYIRYDSRCLPTGVAIGSTTKVDPKMVELLLEWNASDPVSEIEIQRNKYHANTSNQYAQGNRNPFIDNPYLATQIWGGPEANNNWKK